MEARRKYARLCIQIDINKPLVNTILIGRFEQVVVYEGIQKLFFLRGRVGHQVNACLYTVCKGKDLVTTSNMSPSDQIDTSCIGHEESTLALCSVMFATTTSNGSEIEEAEGQYRPWLIVTRKRGGHKGTKPNPTIEGPTKSV